MKKTLQFFAAITLMVCFAAIQPAQAQINYGLKGGLNFANMGGDDVEDSEMRTGFHVGGFLELSLLGIVATEGGLYYSTKGYSFDDFDFISSYIDIPVVAKFSPLPLVHFYAGPQFSILLDSKSEFDGEEVDSGTDGLRDLDLALVLGAGINLPGGLRASLGYDFGLTSLDEDGDLKEYNRVIKLSVGYRF